MTGSPVSAPNGNSGFVPVYPGAFSIQRDIRDQLETLYRLPAASGSASPRYATAYLPEVETTVDAHV